MTFLFVSNIVLILIPSALMYWLGRRYAAKEAASLRGAIGRALGWSIVICWSLLFVTGGMVPGVIPLPSWGAVVYSLTEPDTSVGIRETFIPHPGLSPALPIVVFLLSFRTKGR